MRFQFTFTGRTPLLLHADDIDASDALSEWRKDPANKKVSKPGDDRSPAWTWLAYLYHDGTSLAIPADNLAVCLRQAGARITLKGTKTFKESAVSGLWIEQEHMPILSGGKTIPVAPLLALREQPDYTEHLAAARRAGFTLFAKRAKVTAKGKHIRVRPRIEQWSLSGSLEVSANEITPDILTQLFGEAGRVGLGDWRPGCATPGRFGMFEAKLKPIK